MGGSQAENLHTRFQDSVSLQMFVSSITQIIHQGSRSQLQALDVFQS